MKPDPPASIGDTTPESTALDRIAEAIRRDLDSKNSARDQALARSRELIRFCARSIRAAHRAEYESSLQLLAQAELVVNQLSENLLVYPDLYFAGYTQDAVKEYVEANITLALIRSESLPSPSELRVENAAYLAGLAEAAGEMRRHALDTMRLGDLGRAEAILQRMEEIYGVLVTIDYPDALTRGLRRITDMVRGVLERTRGDLTVAARQDALRKALLDFEERVMVPNVDAEHQSSTRDES